MLHVIQISDHYNKCHDIYLKMPFFVSNPEGWKCLSKN